MRRDDHEGGGENFDGGHGSPHRQATSTILARLAHGQDGLITSRQALSAGVGAGALQWQLDTGGLHRIHDGIYAVGHRDLSDDGWMQAALLAGGDEAAISRESAFRRWRLLDGLPLLPVHITLPREASYVRRRGIRSHRPMDFDPRRDVTDDGGVRTTTIPRSLLDMAAVVPGKRLALALHRARVEHRMPLSALRAVMERAPRARGLGRLHVVAFGGELAPNARERRFLRLVAEAGLPRPQTNVLVETDGGTFVVDCLWPEARLVYEVDDPSHATLLRMTGDRRRDAALGDAGYRVRRVTDDDLWGDGAAALRKRLARQLGRAR